jgi:hypothetical protein
MSVVKLRSLVLARWFTDVREKGMEPGPSSSKFRYSLLLVNEVFNYSYLCATLKTGRQ